MRKKINKYAERLAITTVPCNLVLVLSNITKDEAISYSRPIISRKKEKITDSLCNTIYCALVDM